MFVRSKTVTNQRGSAVIEFLFLFPVVIFIVASTISIGMALRERNLLIDSARQAGRLASIRSSVDGGTSGCNFSPDSGDCSFGLRNSAVPLQKDAMLIACKNIPGGASDPYNSTWTIQVDKPNPVPLPPPPSLAGAPQRKAYFVRIVSTRTDETSWANNILRYLPQLKPEMTLTYPMARGTCP